MKILGIIAAILLGAAGINAALNSQWYARQQQIAAPETQYDAVIRRDGWGVSHILGETDADAAFGLAYADADDHIARLYNARFPARAGGFDWRGVLPGDTSRSLWTTDAPFAAMPFLVDPASGYLFDTNNTPCIATAEVDKLDCESFSPLLGVERNETSRIYRAAKLFVVVPISARRASPPRRRMPQSTCSYDAQLIPNFYDNRHTPVIS